MSLFKKKKTEFGGDEMDIQEQLKKILDQIGFLEKKVDTLLEGNRGGGGSRPFGGDRGGFNRNRGGQGGGFRGGREGQHRGGNSFGGGGNTRFAGDGPRRYSSDNNRGGFGGPRREGGHREGGFRDGGHRGPRREGGHRPPRHNNHGDNFGNHQPQSAPQSVAPEAQPE